MTVRHYDLCIVGGGPAGMVAGLLFARAGAETVVLEKHGDFFRDFRGDTVHPSTLRLFSEMGLLDALLACPHDKVPSIDAHVGERHMKVADFTHFDPRWNFVALMPQWDFLAFVAREARKLPNFTLRMEAEATDLLIDEGVVRGVAWGERRIEAKLVIAADGRRSLMRDKAGLPLRTIGAPMDVFWFRVPKEKTAGNETTGYFTAGRILVLLDRGDYWQCGYVFAKGEVEAIRARGPSAFRDEVAAIAPPLAGHIDEIHDWDQVKLLTVALDRLERWDRRGFLAIGDAAHAMSPVGGVGINVAIQDAVAAANILAGPLARGEPVDDLLGKVCARRMPAVRATQAMQNAVQKRVISPLLGATGPVKPPLFLRMLDRFPVLRRIPAAFIGFGLRPEHVRSPVGERKALAVPRPNSRKSSRDD